MLLQTITTLTLLAGFAASQQTCALSTGQQGLCLSTSNCRSSGGTSTPNLCPGTPADVQCCTYGTCTVPAQANLTGLCVPSASCTDGTVTRGLCPGDAGITCCTWRSCSAGGVPGSCVPAEGCAGGTSTSGLCPGPKGVRCCDYGRCKADGRDGFCQRRGTCGGTVVAGGGCATALGVDCCLSAGGGGGGEECGPPKLNQASLDLVKEFEGWFPDIYLDPVGLPTVGYGHLCSNPTCSEVPYPIPLSVANGEALLQSDLGIARRCLSADLVDSVVLNPNQYGALVSWVFNMGCGAQKSSTLTARLNAGEDKSVVARQELPRWVYAGGQVLNGLVRRRAAEVALFDTPAEGVAHPPRPC
ncbi:hypothetical protein MCOR27_004726 [Pyricularia oryzae]|uniref:Lysozyme n=4 Tax=Pyricularia TaxID=48558 RepID=A0ABQ8NSD9_PYRGI|nr:glycoside hydrolase [Pyricularia oryzae Y34]KAH8845052.1 hypothetical protein MCOR01_002306 [Pyricularia oryzae]KAI6301421.1 hypothetical protein MCOR33_003096 [Pyricularia grisea]KAH9429102.1 hypothetical protein MCOR02_010512 [Pyricularia oryzae]KAI6261328.1 hypothetical protein MCOR19_002363 [Pyricularia oryzae]